MPRQEAQPGVREVVESRNTDPTILLRRSLMNSWTQSTVPRKILSRTGCEAKICPQQSAFAPKRRAQRWISSLKARGFVPKRYFSAQRSLPKANSVSADIEDGVTRRPNLMIRVSYNLIRQKHRSITICLGNAHRLAAVEIALQAVTGSGFCFRTISMGNAH